MTKSKMESAANPHSLRAIFHFHKLPGFDKYSGLNLKLNLAFGLLALSTLIELKLNSGRFM